MRGKPVLVTRRLGLRWPRGLPGVGAAVVAALALMVVVLSALLLWALVTPVRPLGAWQPGLAQLMNSDQRRSLMAGFDPFFRSAPRGDDADAVTALDLTLYGVRLNEATGGGGAIIAASDGEQRSHWVGDEVLPGVTLVAVGFDHVVLERGGARETLYLDQSGGGGSGVDPVAVTDPAGTAAPPGAGGLTARDIASGIALSPRSEGGKVTGIVVQPQGDGAVLRRSGLRPGDVIRGVNGRPVGAAADLAGAIAPGARLSLEVERGAEVIPVALILEQ